MRVAVAGGTGLTGRHVVNALRAEGHHPVVLARSTGIDLLTGAGLDLGLLLSDVDAVIDVTNTAQTDAAGAPQFFDTVTTRLLAAEERAEVRHHVLLSIVGVDRVQGNDHYVGKRRQEELVANGPVPWTIQRATQFFEFAQLAVDWTLRDGEAPVPAVRVQPVAAADVAAALAELSVGSPRGRAPDLAGPEIHDLPEMARRVVALRGQEVRVLPGREDALFGSGPVGDALLPGPGARLAPTTFDTWIAEQAELSADLPAERFGEAGD